MESLGKDHAYSDSSLPSSAVHEEYAVPDVIITRRLRDREQLRKRKAEAQEKDSMQWVLREQTKRQRRGRGARRGRGRQPVVEINLEPEPEPDSQPNPEEEAEPVPSESAAPSELVHQEQPPMLTFQDMVSGMQPGVVERELAARSQDPAGELPESHLPHGGLGSRAVLPHEDCHPRLPILSTTGLQHNYSMGP